MNMSEYFKLLDFNPDLLDIAMVKSYVSSMKQEKSQRASSEKRSRQIYFIEGSLFHTISLRYV